MLTRHEEAPKPLAVVHAESFPRLRWGLASTLHPPLDLHFKSQVSYGSATGILKKHCQSP